MDASIARHSITKPDMRPKRRDDLNVRVIDGSTDVLDRRANFIHQLNEVATDVWDLTTENVHRDRSSSS
jgi:hypothetical protein